MKKATIFIIAAVGFTFASCKKCEECHYDDADGNEAEIGEICDEELEDAEANGYAVGDTTYTIHCEEH
ncbi:MAG: hypothetical protein WDZ35_16260 [Crocinitomicaceae bacterium]